MTSITSSMSTGLSMMDSRIDRAAATGKVSATDQTALESALGTIQSQLSASSADASTTPTDMKDKIDTLIQGQVTAGTLTSDQASELQGFFAQGAQGAHGHHGGHGGGGAIAALVGTSDSSVPPIATTGSSSIDGTATTDSDDGDDAASTSVSSSSSTQATEQQQLDSLISFLQNMRSSLTAGTYGTAATGSSSNTGVLLDTAA